MKKWLLLALFGLSLSGKAQKKYDLQECVATALQNNLQLKQSQLQIQNGQNTLDQSRYNRYPNLNFNAGGGLQSGRNIDPFTNQFVERTVNFANTGINSGVTLFNGYQIKNMNQNITQGCKRSKRKNSPVHLNEFVKATTIFSLIIFLVLQFAGCTESTSKTAEKKVAIKRENVDKPTSENIKQMLDFAIKHNGKVDDSSQLKFGIIVKDFYEANEYSNLWSRHQQWLPLADSLFDCLSKAEYFGLFPAQFNLKNLVQIKKLIASDSAHKADPTLWSKADIFFTDDCLHLLKEIKFGRLANDSLSYVVDTFPQYKYLITTFANLFKLDSLSKWIAMAEPKYSGYKNLRDAIPHFLDSMDRHLYTYVPYPYKKNDAKDSLLFIKNMQLRLKESNCIAFTNQFPDSLQLDSALKKFQKKKGLKQDGKINTFLIKVMNTNDVERFKRIAVTLDRYKQLPDSMPRKYIWVNLPSFYLQLWDEDTLALESKIICGKPDTRTPELNSIISNMVIYPTWTVPNSIIMKQYLPKLKKNPNYLSRLGLKLKNEKGENIDPTGISWDKYHKGIPYKVMQGSGDDNALGVMKFNFDNPYAVYLHDTNQRYLFGKSSRALSHGCVRVQKWDSLAFYIARNDSLNLKLGDTLRYTTDSIKNWLLAKKYKRINVKNEIALYLKYFGCEGKAGKIKFYEDIYGEDKVMREKYFSFK